MAETYDITELAFAPKPTRRDFIDIDGQRFERLLVLGYYGKTNPRAQGKWYCKCDCGKITTVTTGKLTSGHTKSCGCYSRERLVAAFTKHGHARAYNPSPEYRSYQAAKSRCTFPSVVGYPMYGGRGIEFRFTSFEEFLSEVGFKPTPEHSLDRIDSNGHYEKGNVRWATRKEQCRNTRRNINLTYNQKTQCMSAWAEELGVSERLIQSRITRGWCVPCALTVPVKTLTRPCGHKSARDVTSVSEQFDELDSGIRP